MTSTTHLGHLLLAQRAPGWHPASPLLGRGRHLQVGGKGRALMRALAINNELVLLVVLLVDAIRTADTQRYGEVFHERSAALISLPVLQPARPRLPQTEAPV